LKQKFKPDISTIYLFFQILIDWFFWIINCLVFLLQKSFICDLKPSIKIYGQNLEKYTNTFKKSFFELLSIITFNWRLKITNNFFDLKIALVVHIFLLMKFTKFFLLKWSLNFCPKYNIGFRLKMTNLQFAIIRMSTHCW